MAKELRLTDYVGKDLMNMSKEELRHGISLWTNAEAEGARSGETGKGDLAVVTAIIAATAVKKEGAEKLRSRIAEIEQQIAQLEA